MPASGNQPPSDTPPDAERRDLQRVEILGTLDAEVMMALPLTIIDISAAGLQTLSTFPFQLNSLHEFRLTLDQRVVVVKGRVVHSTIVELDSSGAHYRTGIDFIDLADASRLALAAYASKLTRGRHAR